MDLTIQDLPQRRLAYLEHRGAYPDIGPAFGRLAEIAKAGGLLPGAFENAVGLYFDDPNVVPASEQRAWAALIVDETAKIPAGLTEGWLEGGRHAVGLHIGSYSAMMDAWRETYRLVAEQGLRPRMAPPFEHYVNDCNVVPVEELCTEICIPIE